MIKIELHDEEDMGLLVEFIELITVELSSLLRESILESER